MSENDDIKTDDKNKADPEVKDDNTPSDPPSDPPKDPPADPPDNKDSNDPLDEDDNNEEPESWGDTGTDVGNSVLTVLQESGIETGKAKELLYDAVAQGDPTLIDEAALAEAMGSAAQARIVVSGVKSHVKEINDRAAAIKESLYEEVGSAENWETLSKWARETLPKEELAEYIELVGQGGRKAKLAVRDLMEQYEDGGNTSLKDTTFVPKTTRKTQNSVEPLSRNEYFQAMEKAQREGKLNESTKAKLWKQRQAGVQAGK